MTDKTDIAALRPSERAKLGFVTDDNTGGYYVAECEECGQIFPSQNAEGGGPIADSGDYDDCYCPHCGHVDPEECDNANLVWNVQQLKIITLTSQLEAERQQREALEAAALAMRDDMRVAREELAALRGVQEPVGIFAGTDEYSEVRHISWLSGASKLQLGDKLFTHPHKPVVVRKIGHIDHDGGEYGEYFVELTDSAEIGRAVYVIEEGEAAGIVVKDGAE